ncbi:MAG: hypothetical protein ACOCU4_02895 [Alkalispirochaeta sp.]
MRGREVQEFETKLKKLFDQIDAELEDQWGGEYPLHPARPPRGKSSNPETDGLFNVGASFSTGYGSDHGRGYVIETRMVTLTSVDDETREEIRAYVARRVDELLPEYFPDRDLDVVRDGDMYKVTGDLSL